MASDEPRGHHLLAQLYQRGFANERDQVRVVARDTGRSYTANVAKVFKRQDFNAFRDASGNLCQDVEKLLAKHVDTPASRGLSALRAGTFPPAGEEREDVARFMAAQLTRGMHFRGETDRFMSGLGSHILSLVGQHYIDAHWQRALGEVPPDEVRQALAEGRGIEVRASQAQLLEMMLSPIDDVTGMLLQRAWTLVDFARPCLFTSGEPVTLWNPSGAAGVGTAQDIALPVSTTKALVLTWPGSGLEENTLPGSDEFAARVNARTLCSPLSEHLLLSPDIDSHPLPDDLGPTDCAPETLAQLRGS